MSELVSEAVQLLVVGVCTVFVALIVTGLVVMLLGRLLRDKPPVPAAAAKPLPEESLSGVDKHVLVLLAAAATVAVKRPVRIRRVRFVTHKHIPSGWAATGRADHTKDILH